MSTLSRQPWKTRAAEAIRAFAEKADAGLWWDPGLARTELIPRRHPHLLRSALREWGAQPLATDVLTPQIYGGAPEAWVVRADDHRGYVVRRSGAYIGVGLPEFCALVPWEVLGAEVLTLLNDDGRWGAVTPWGDSRIPEWARAGVYLERVPGEVLSAVADTAAALGTDAALDAWTALAPEGVVDALGRTRRTHGLRWARWRADGRTTDRASMAVTLKCAPQGRWVGTAG